MQPLVGSRLTRTETQTQAILPWIAAMEGMAVCELRIDNRGLWSVTRVKK